MLIFFSFLFWNWINRVNITRLTQSVVYYSWIFRLRMKLYKEQIGVVMETWYYIMVQSYYSCRQQVFPSGMVAMAFVAWKLSLDHISWPISARSVKERQNDCSKGLGQHGLSILSWKLTILKNILNKNNTLLEKQLLTLLLAGVNFEYRLYKRIQKKFTKTANVCVE